MKPIFLIPIALALLAGACSFPGVVREQIPQPRTDIAPETVELHLKESGYKCDGILAFNQDGKDRYSWSCEKKLGDVDFYVYMESARSDYVDIILASVTQAFPSEAITSGFFTRMADIRFGAKPDLQSQADAWIVKALPLLTGNAGEAETTTVDGLPLKMFGSPNARFLQMGE